MTQGIQLGALICLADAEDIQQWLFLGPGGASMKLMAQGQVIQVISTAAPLGQAMLGKCEGDELVIQLAATRQQFEVLWVK